MSLRKSLTLLTTLLAVLAVGACSSSSSDDPPPNDDPIADADGDGVADADDNCVDEPNADQSDADLDGAGDACDPIPTEYAYESQLVSGESSVAYPGQTMRQMLIEKLVDEMLGLEDDPGRTTEEVVADLDFFFRFDSATSGGLNHEFTLAGGEPVTPGPTWNDVGSGKDLVGKIAGNDPPELLDGEFFGWTEGMDTDPVPEELVEYFFDALAQEATDGTAPQLETTGGSEQLPPDVNYVNDVGHDLRQLVQKFLLGAVAFAQGTNDYLQTDWEATNTQEDSNPYTEAEHNWDEAFGYFGAARNYGEYTDDEIRASGPDRRAEFENGYNDANGDGLIDLESEFNFGNSTNCAKRDAGATVATDFTQDAFDAFLLGREILMNGAGGSYTAEQLDAIREQVLIASRTWEKCVSATVVHYINDVIAEMEKFSNGQYQDVDNFLNLAKTWGEMKGFALGLQFNPDSPFRSGTVDGIDIDDLKEVHTLMGDAPVLADGSQLGDPPSGTAQEAIDGYIDDLLAARDILQAAYEFDADNTANW